MTRIVYWTVAAIVFYAITRPKFGGFQNFGGALMAAALWPVSALALLYIGIKTKVFRSPFCDADVPIALIFACVGLIAAVIGIRS